MSIVESEKIPEVIFQTEKRDEEQIILEMQSQVAREWVYTINIRGQQVTSLSYAGVKEAVRRRGNFRFVPCSHCGKTVHVDEDEKEYRALVTVHDENRNVMFIGAAQSFKNQPFAWAIAANKAERNALRKMLPEKQIAALIQSYLKREAPNPASVTPGKLG
jgi:NAD-dependent SIR2 family protein deacetylase